jgi:hypothetical protein
MRSSQLVWVDQADLGSAEMLEESRRHLDFLHDQLRATNDAIDSARSCIDGSWELLAQFNRHTEADLRHEAKRRGGG